MNADLPPDNVRMNADPQARESSTIQESRMKAAVFQGVGRIETRTDLARPRPGPGEVLIQVEI